MYILRTFSICRASREWGDSDFGLDIAEGVATMREHFASIVSPLQALHAFIGSWVILIFMVFIFGNSRRELLPLRKQERFARAVRCSFPVAAALRLYFSRLHHMTYIRSWAMRFWSWEVLKLNWIVEIEQHLWLLWFAIFASEMIGICMGFWDYRTQFNPQFDIYPWQ
jgi:hypothetical protein